MCNKPRASLYDTSNDNRDSCIVIASVIKSLHWETFKTDLTFKTGLIFKTGLTFLECHKSILLGHAWPQNKNEFYILEAFSV